MPYVMVKNDATGKLEPMHVTKEKYDEHGVKATQFSSKKKAQAACDMVNANEHKSN